MWQPKHHPDQKKETKAKQLDRYLIVLFKPEGHLRHKTIFDHSSTNFVNLILSQVVQWIWLRKGQQKKLNKTLQPTTNGNKNAQLIKCNSTL